MGKGVPRVPVSNKPCAMTWKFRFEEWRKNVAGLQCKILVSVSCYALQHPADPSFWNCKISATMFELSFIHLWRFRDILVMEFFQIFLSCTFKYVSYVFYEYKFVELEIIINSVDSGISFKVFRRGLWNVSARRLKLDSIEWNLFLRVILSIIDGSWNQ